MKKVFICMLALFFSLSFFPNEQAGAENEKFIQMPVSASYSSVYWWRGLELNGKGVGVFWPGAGLVIGDTGIELSFAAGISEDIFSTENQNSHPDYFSSDRAEQAKTELDYGASYSIDIADKISLGMGLLFAHYPYYGRADSSTINPSFFEGSLSLALNSLLSPTVDFYYDLYVKDTYTPLTAAEEAIYQGFNLTAAQMEYRAKIDNKTPRNQDYYITISLSHDLISTDDFSFSISCLVGYYNNAYLDLKGWSDYVISTGISKDYENLSFTGGINFARTLDKDFIADTMKNHFWADFGVTYSYGLL